ncbi:protein kinase domain-containing protein [Roseibacillus ishigakijimensis]|uniref:Protein kinase n=1 Tax=Roseibacillus ishigakijimensis TaxID=454146 RepID=A0A934RMI9_9BACT|nr:protein kinase [Roseibacillus ishigakijimensis]MBK1834134.1 protein kinase [Roseibacillus ishigakijimensis]
MSEDNPTFEVLPAEEVEQLLPAYSQLSFLAQGGMAAVYRGVQTSLDRPVAIKLLPREFGTSESFRLRFVAEGKAMAKLNHPNLVGIFDFGEVDGLLYLVMEYVEGKTLYHDTYGTQVDEYRALEICAKVADGLAHAHEHGILHRDIKPANVLLNAEGEPKLGDFGLAEEEERAEGDDLVFGTPGYTSPEVMANPAAADEKADIYAIGVMLYELLTTQLPTDPYQAPSRVVQSDPRIDPIIAKAIQPDPTYRHATARELAEHLHSVLASMKAAPRRRLATGSPSASPAAVKVATGGARPLVTQAGPAAALPPRTPPRKKSQTDFVLLRNMLIIIGLCVAIFGAWTALKQKETLTAKDKTKNEELKKLEARKKEAARRAEANPNGSLNGGTITTPPVAKEEAPAPAEPDPLAGLSPAEQLAALKDRLAAGDHSKFPEGTRQRGASHYFLVEEPLSWYQAIDYAEQHGGHLAIAANQDDLRWLSSHLPDGKNSWLGAGAIARNDWAWQDQEIPFSLEKPRTSTGTALMVNAVTVLWARQPAEAQPFFIQWDEGDKEPLRATELATIAQTLESNKPVWPAGTVSSLGKRYLILAQATSLAEALAQAEQAGGTLAAASDEIEGNFLRQITSQSGLSHLWLGAQYREGNWQWLTGEPWEFAQWKEGFPKEDPELAGLLVTPEGWQNEHPGEPVGGFIIEWSKDAEGLSAHDLAPSAPSEMTVLKSKAVEMLQENRRAHLKRIADNVTAQGMSLRQWLRNIPKEEATTLAGRYEAYQTTLDQAAPYLPDPAEVTGLPAEAMKILHRHHQQQKDYLASFHQEADVIRAAYLKRAQAEHQKLTERGLNSRLATLEEEMAAAGTDGESFVAHILGE